MTFRHGLCGAEQLKLKNLIMLTASECVFCCLAALFENEIVVVQIVTKQLIKTALFV